MPSQSIVPSRTLSNMTYMSDVGPILRERENSDAVGASIKLMITNSGNWVEILLISPTKFIAVFKSNK